MEDNKLVKELIHKYSDEIKNSGRGLAIILAAGHGKRIKSHKSKMLHKIWDIPTVERVYNACVSAIPDINTIVVVGTKAKDVIEVIGKRNNNLFAYQEVQNGTGHAVQVALENVNSVFSGIVYVLPGDMGLIDDDTLSMFKEKFVASGNDMFVLTGIYSGDPMKNSYGRIIRTKDKDINGKDSGEDKGKVFSIMEFKDILSLSNNYRFQYNGREYEYSKEELINNNEFNSGVYAFTYDKLVELVHDLSNNNAQNEIYITDLIGLFNHKGYSVGAVSPNEQHVIMGFNDKSVLREMETIARNKTYEKLKNIIEIQDPEDFFIDESVVKQILELDKLGNPLDINIGKGVHIGRGVKLNYNLTLKKNVFVSSNVIFGQNVTVWENVHLSCFPNQKFVIGDNVEILWGDIIKGEITIGNNSRIESSVNMTGSNEFPLRIGNNVLIKGTSYIFGSIIEDDLFIEHSVLIRKRVEKIIKKNGTIQPIKFYLPMPEGIDAVEDL